jgi:hypothetical protein
MMIITCPALTHQKLSLSSILVHELLIPEKLHLKSIGPDRKRQDRILNFAQETGYPITLRVARVPLRCHECS